MKITKGFEIGRKNLIKLAKTAGTKAGAHAYVDRRLKKRTMKGLWQIRINAGARENGMNFSKLMGALKTKNIGINKKVLSEIAKDKPEVFKKIVEFVK